MNEMQVSPGTDGYAMLWQAQKEFGETSTFFWNNSSCDVGGAGSSAVHDRPFAARAQLLN
jgi:hypothetical protein